MTQGLFLILSLFVFDISTLWKSPTLLLLPNILSPAPKLSPPPFLPLLSCFSRLFLLPTRLLADKITGEGGNIVGEVQESATLGGEQVVGGNILDGEQVISGNILDGEEIEGSNILDGEELVGGNIARLN